MPVWALPLGPLAPALGPLLPLSLSLPAAAPPALEPREDAEWLDAADETAEAADTAAASSCARVSWDAPIGAVKALAPAAVSSRRAHFSMDVTPCVKNGRRSTEADP